MVHQPPPDEYDHREEGCSLFEWPLSDEALHMGAGELLDSLIDTIRRLNADPQWDRTLIFPRFGDVADMAYAALSELALHCHNRRNDEAWEMASGAVKDAHALATIVGDWIEDMEDED